LVVSFYSLALFGSSLSIKELKKLPNGAVEHIQSVYNDIYIAKQNNYIKMFFHRHKNYYTESVRDISNDLILPINYTQLLNVIFAYKQNPKSVVMLGLGGGTTTRYIENYYPKTDIYAVELDQSVIDMAKKYFAIKESKHYKIINKDARIFMKKIKKKFDIIMIDTFRGGYIPFHLLTQEFYNLLQQKMDDESYLVLNLHGGTKLFDSSIATLKTVFKNIDTYFVPRSGNVIVIASNAKKYDKNQLYTQASNIQNEKKFFYSVPSMLRYSKNYNLKKNTPIFTDNFAPVNIFKQIKSNNKARW
jgi:spermidine synthase